MSVDWAAFTPAGAAIGGAMIGLAAALLILGAGRVAGIAGILGGEFQNLRRGQPLGRDAIRWAFLAGLLIAPWLWRLAVPLPPVQVTGSTMLVVTGGLLVGVGVRLGNGCTSGHGVCGLSRFSLRSLVNVLAFMGAGVVTVFVLRHLVGA